MKAQEFLYPGNTFIREEVIKIMNKYAQQESREMAINFAIHLLGYDTFPSSVTKFQDEKVMGNIFDEWQKQTKQ